MSATSPPTRPHPGSPPTLPHPASPPTSPTHSPDTALAYSPRPGSESSDEHDVVPDFPPLDDRARSHPNLLITATRQQPPAVSSRITPRPGSARPPKLFRTHSWPPSARVFKHTGEQDQHDVYRFPAPQQSLDDAKIVLHEPVEETQVVGDESAEQFPPISGWGLIPQLSDTKSVQNFALRHPSIAVSDRFKALDVAFNDDDSAHSTYAGSSVRATHTPPELVGLDESKRSWRSAVAARWAKGQQAIWEKREKHKQRRLKRAHDHDEAIRAERRRERSESKERERFAEEQRKEKDRAKEAKKDPATKLKELVVDPLKKDKHVADKKDVKAEPPKEPPPKEPPPRRSHSKSRRKVCNPPHELSMSPLEILELQRGRERGAWFSGFDSKGHIIYAESPHLRRRRHRTASGRRSVWIEPSPLLRPVAEENPSNKSRVSRGKFKLDNSHEATTPDHETPTVIISSEATRRGRTRSHSGRVKANELDARLKELRATAANYPFEPGFPCI